MLKKLNPLVSDGAVRIVGEMPGEAARSSGMSTPAHLLTALELFLRGKPPKSSCIRRLRNTTRTACLPPTSSGNSKPVRNCFGRMFPIPNG